jgi:hypothetical protein
MSDDNDEKTTLYSDNDGITVVSNTRWTYIGTTLSALMLLSLAVITVGTAAGVFSLSPITQAWFVLYATVTLMAATWAFGEETLAAVKKARNK